MTLRQLLEDQKQDVDELLDTEIGQPTGSTNPSIRANLEQDGTQVTIVLPPAWSR